MKKTAFRRPANESRPTSTAADEWVRGETAAPPANVAPASAPDKLARLTIDVPSDLHAQFKAACAQHRTKMKAEVLQFIEDWTQKHSNQ
jgi:ParG